MGGVGFDSSLESMSVEPRWLCGLSIGVIISKRGGFWLMPTMKLGEVSKLRNMSMGYIALNAAGL